MRRQGLLALLPPLVLVLPLALPMDAGAFDELWFTQRSQPKEASLKRTSAPARIARSGMVDRLVVKKSERRLYLMRGDEPYRSYPIALGYSPVGHKRRQGDGKTPEGVYFIDGRNARSNYRKALSISYPNTGDRLHAMRSGRNPGGMIMIHGQPSRGGERKTGDWTFGCIAVSNMAIDEIWALTSDGTPIEILP
jgi:murein L,D-transpeptidase YafK